MANEIIIVQNELYERLQKAEMNYKKTPKERLKYVYIETRLQNLEELWRDFREGHKNLIPLVGKGNKDTHNYFTEDIYDKFEEQYTAYKSHLKTALNTLVGKQNQPTSEMLVDVIKSREVKLPRIELPTFSGKYDEWQSFYDMFVSLIHSNSTLSGVQKLHYLKTNLSGEPAVLLRNFATTDQNYDEAWKQLVKRYNNKRYNANGILKTFFSQKQITNESSNAIKQLLDTTSSCLQSLENLGVQAKSCDAFVVFYVVSRLDTESHRLWEQQLSTSMDKMPTWSELTEFLECRFHSLEMLDPSKQTTKLMSTCKLNQHSKPRSYHSAAITGNNIPYSSCVLCNGSHYVYHCQRFIQKPIQERINFVQEKGLCFNCMCHNHVVHQCRQSTCCRKCGKRHHTSLHIEKQESAQEQKSNRIQSQSHNKSDKGSYITTQSNTSTSTNEERPIVAHFSRGQLQSCDVLLATAVINAHARNGKKYQIRALLDQGSQASFITENTVQLLGLKRFAINGMVSGLGDGQMRIKYYVSLQIESRYHSNLSFQVEAYVLGTLTSMLPSNKLITHEWGELETLQLADCNYTTPGKIDILLGAEVYSAILLNNLLKHPEGNLIAQNTAFGWIISGRMTTNDKQRDRVINMCVQVRDDDYLKTFWELEAEPDLIKKKFTVEEERCEQIYNETTTRTNTGRFIVRLPFKRKEPECQYGNTRLIAERKLLSLNRRLAMNNNLRMEYESVIKEYLTLQHMEPVPHNEIENLRSAYLPHHAVVRDDKETTRVRIVMNASSKGTNGVSLNDDLMVGPKLQQDLRHLLMRWRMHPICIVADVIKMFRQVLVHKDDADFQRILWISDEDEPCDGKGNTTSPAIEHYRLVTLTFGTACAPYLAVKTLQRLACEEQNNYPTAAEIAKSDYFVDDLMSGAQGYHEAIHIYEEMNKLMNSGGFQLQKWSSNCHRLLEYIGQDKQNSEVAVPIKNDSMIKVLGICWNRESDSFEYTLDVTNVKPSATKRQMLSDIARLYDPLGWIAPVVIRAKILIQKVWKAKLDWDDEMNGNLLQEWLKFKSELIDVKTISIPRWQNCTHESKLELHAFSDASTAGFAAVVYLRVVTHDNNIHVSIISAKTKVAPVEREISVPRLELCGAVLAAKLLSEISQVMNIGKGSLFAWTDSQIVLAWLRGGASKWTTFVSNRVSEILTILDYDQWGHVTTETNPADCASRGLRPSELKSYNLWWNGPNWLHDENFKRKHMEIAETSEEERVKSFKITQDKIEDFAYTRFSKLTRMLRVLSYCKRTLYWKSSKEERSKLQPYITTEEMNSILELSIKQAQEFEFGEDIKQLKQKGIVLKRSILHTLCPILDQNGILRVGGRIELSHLSYDERHPIIMPAKSHLTELIIRDTHYKTLHGGIQIMLNHLRSKYWILRGREQVKKLYRNCNTCRRYSKPNTQLMGQLPEVRLTPSKPFKSTGVDYAGPINIRFSPGRGSKSYKGYICLFVCMVTRAVHIEVVSDLTSKGFIAAFRRFTSRRGHCRDLYSDNGTNFVGADKLLRDLFNCTKSQLPNEIAQALTLENTHWHFIPPHAPNFGGLWEAGVRSIKTHLRKVIGDSTLTFEELTTLLTQVESCLNSRPISLLSDDPNDPRPLTPGHFLVGEPLLNITELENIGLGDSYNNYYNISNIDRWRLIQKMVNDLWKRWSKEYLTTLSQRYKWHSKKPEPELGDIVIIREDNVPPCSWILGVISDKHTGHDNVTRVVTIKTKNNNTLKRPVSKVIVLHK